MRKLDSLGIVSLTPKIIKEFADHGIFLVEDLLLENTYRLQTSGTEAQKQAIADIVQYQEQQLCLHRSGDHMLQKLGAPGDRYLSTGCESLDRLLEGGLREGMVTELVGGSSTGKTQVCMQVAASVTFRYRAMVGYVDTCHSFSATRISHMLGGLLGGRDAAQRRAEAADEIGEAMKSIKHYSIFDISSMLSLLNQLHVNLQGRAETKRMRLLIIDSVSSVISPVLGGTRGHALMTSMGTTLKKLAEKNHLAVLITNHTVGGEGGQVKPALGEFWKFMPSARLLLALNEHASFQITRTGLKPAS